MHLWYEIFASCSCILSFMFSMSGALLEAFQWSELLVIFLVQAAGDIESRALLALVIFSLRLDSIRVIFKITPAPPIFYLTS